MKDTLTVDQLRASIQSTRIVAQTVSAICDDVFPRLRPKDLIDITNGETIQIPISSDITLALITECAKRGNGSALLDMLEEFGFYHCLDFDVFVDESNPGKTTVLCLIGKLDWPKGPFDDGDDDDDQPTATIEQTQKVLAVAAGSSK